MKFHATNTSSLYGFAAHETRVVKDLMEKLSIVAGMYPSDCTPFLKNCDLVVNGPMERHTMTARIRHTYNAFQAYLAEYAGMSDD